MTDRIDITAFPTVYEETVQTTQGDLNEYGLKEVWWLGRASARPCRLS